MAGNSAGQDNAGPRRTALGLMRMALALLDRSGEGLAAARLQQAIDTVEGDGPGEPTHEQIRAILGPHWAEDFPVPASIAGSVPLPGLGR